MALFYQEKNASSDEKTLDLMEWPPGIDRVTSWNISSVSLRFAASWCDKQKQLEQASVMTLQFVVQTSFGCYYVIISEMISPPHIACVLSGALQITVPLDF